MADRQDLAKPGDFAGTANRADELIYGRLHCIMSFDWGEEVDLEAAAKRVQAQQGLLPRRRRTPSSIEYRPTPVRIVLPPTPLPLLAAEPAETEAVVFDFGATNVIFRIPFAGTRAQLAKLASSLAEPDHLVQAARAAAAPLFQELLPAIREPAWSELYEEYFVFQMEPQVALRSVADLLSHERDWLASLLRLDDGPLCEDEIHEALKWRISYRPNDMVIAEWAAAVIVDHDCDETLHVIEFANLQLLEFRLVDQRVGDALMAAQRYVQPVARSLGPLWRTQSQPLRMLNAMRADALGTFERANSVLLLMGDQYLARVYRIFANRFRLDDWASSVRQTLDVTEGVHEMISSQSAMFRLEALEVIVILLIALEILLALFVH